MNAPAVVRRGRRNAKRTAKRNAKQAADSTALEGVARAGMVAQGVLYVLVGLLALRIGFGEGGKAADQGGALRQLAEQPFGRFLIWGVGIGLAGLALWRLSEALFGASEKGGHKSHKRLMSAGRFVLYGVIAFSVLSYAAGEKGSGSSDAKSQDVTARALSAPAGELLVGGVGLALAAMGAWGAVQAVRRKYHDQLRMSKIPRRKRKWIDVLGVSGGVARGAVLVVLGLFAMEAAWSDDAGEVKGMDEALRTFAQTPAGPWLLVAVAVGVTLYGLFSFALARWRRV
ncbi:hypothetical protein DB35_28840 [Streptomyces abyssalis]|uniref:DUF1206 domain-containing protein n=1 Tax=Streptomyces abyssalis TaxID=933944 RepID=A0A1E7JJW1_9ACTN|nr:DUF1206 domain-containing protein [Streptomyces abyssalis]OEU87411.1 hypothetical protein DB35_28840 [Streptomyces abyssalis]OEU87937.1 hypothetical protein AN215_16895 [Streptomyces abyssalis]